MRLIIRQILLWQLLLTIFSHMAVPESKSSTLELKRIDSGQKEMVAKADIDGLAKLAHPDLRINAPTERILTRARFLSLMRSGEIGAEAFERTVESVSVTGDVGVVMGHETYTPTANSELGKKYGVRPLKRRYTNIYIRQNGAWLWLARQANVVLDQ